MHSSDDFEKNNSPQKKSLPPRSAKNKIMDLLASREHSEKELRQKLKDRDFTDAEIDKAIQEAKDHKWLPETSELAERFANSLHQKNKGFLYINHQLTAKGLPQIEMNPELELEKAQRIVKNKYPGDFEKLPREEKARVARFLTSRGFDSSTIRRIIYEEF